MVPFIPLLMSLGTIIIILLVSTVLMIGSRTQHQTILQHLLKMLLHFTHHISSFLMLLVIKSSVHFTSQASKPQTTSISAHSSFFLYATADVVKHTFDATTQYAHSISSSTLMKKIICSLFLALNVQCRYKVFATDTV